MEKAGAPVARLDRPTRTPKNGGGMGAARPFPARPGHARAPCARSARAILALTGPDPPAGIPPGPVLGAFPDDLSILPDGDEATGVALLRIRIRLALEIETSVAPHRPGRGGRAALALHHAKAMTARFPDAAAIAALPGTIIGHFPFTGRMSVNAAKTCRIRWQAGRLRCRRAIVERRPAIVAEARYAHGCSSFGRTSPIVMVKPARASSSHKASVVAARDARSF